eukprot:maker-scaffold_5-snap-gene-8.12-mRNA-1 protein AED:0.02 eAED:0.02 QI:99/1/1/1/0/0/2/287/129
MDEESISSDKTDDAYTRAEKEKIRFDTELEFVQTLANPDYLNFLAQNLFFEDETFLNYIKYLQYWRDPKYSKYIIYPQSLYFLNLLSDEEFRTKLKNPEVCKFISQQQISQWKKNSTITKTEEEKLESA